MDSQLILSADEFFALSIWQHKTHSRDCIICPDCHAAIINPQEYVDVENNEQEFYCPFCETLIQVKMHAWYTSAKHLSGYKPRKDTETAERELYEKRLRGDWS